MATFIAYSVESSLYMLRLKQRQPSICCGELRALFLCVMILIIHFNTGQAPRLWSRLLPLIRPQATSISHSLSWAAPSASRRRRRAQHVRSGIVAELMRSSQPPRHHRSWTLCSDHASGTLAQAARLRWWRSVRTSRTSRSCAECARRSRMLRPWNGSPCAPRRRKRGKKLI
jgi:hypothetical protein